MPLSVGGGGGSLGFDMGGGEGVVDTAMVGGGRIWMENLVRT